MSILAEKIIICVKAVRLGCKGCLSLCDIWSVCVRRVQSHLVPETEMLAPRLCRHAVRHMCPSSTMRVLSLPHSHPILLSINIWLLPEPIIRLIHGTGSLLSGTYDYAWTYLHYVWTIPSPPPWCNPPYCFHLAAVPSDTLTNFSVIKDSAYFIKVEGSPVSDILCHY